MKSKNEIREKLTELKVYDTDLGKALQETTLYWKEREMAYETAKNFGKIKILEWVLDD